MAEQKRLKGFAIQKGKDYKGKLSKDYIGLKYVYAEDKYDGLRGIMIVRKGKAKAYTSSGVRVVNARHLEKLFELDPCTDNRVFDGEWFCKDWNLTQSIVKTQSKHAKASKLMYKMFDCIAISEWDNKVGITPYDIRRRRLKLIIRKLKRKHGNTTSQRLFVNVPIPIKPTDEAIKTYMEAAVKAKHEGVMIKHPKAPYLFKRGYAWFKLKPKYDADLKIVGAELGDDSKANSHHLGRIHLEGKIDGKKVKTHAGNGFKKHERTSLWKLHLKGKLVGKTATITHEGVTVNGKVRFPEFVRIHAEK